MGGEWLSKLTQWLWELLQQFWDALESFLGDLILAWLEQMLTVYCLMIEAIPAPEFLTQYSLNSLLGSAGPVIGWLVGTFRIGECLAVIGAGYAFRLVRKLLTLGQW